jgi:vacuolar-type H+-ATPase subunit I/STV1
MTSQIARISKDKEAADNIRKVAQSLNIIIYGRHEREIRNKQAEESSMKELTELQKKLTMLIKEGFIKDFNSLKEYIRGLWKAKYQPKEIFE